MRIALFLFTIISTLLHGQSALAYLTIGESGEMIGHGQYQVGLEPQVFTNNGGGTNLDAFIDTGLNESMSTRLSLGFGKVDFHTGASVKWIPYPDVDNQPAIGGKAAFWYGRIDSNNALTAMVAPLISKKYDTEYGLFVPYIAVPFSFTNTKDSNTNGTQFIVGSDFIHPEVQDASFGGEIGLNLNNAYSYISAVVRFPFDASKGFGLQRKK